MRRMLRLSLICCALLGLSLASEAQVIDGFDLMKEGKFEEAYQAFRQDLSSNRKTPVAAYGLATLYATESFRGYRPDSTYKYLLIAQSGYQSANANRKYKYSKWGLDYNQMRRMKQRLEEAALEKAKEEDSMEAYHDFIETYAGAPRRVRVEAERLRNERALERAAATNSLEECEELVALYGREMKRQMPEAYPAVETNLFDLFIARHGWEKIEDFARLHPDNQYMSDPQLEAFLEIRDGGDAQQFEDFSRQHPGSLYARMAADSLAAGVFRRLVGQGDLQAYVAFVAEYPRSSFVEELDPYLSQAFAEEPYLHILEPVLSRIDEARLPATLEQVYERYAFPGELNLLQRFESRYDGYANAERIRTDKELTRRYEELLNMLYYQGAETEEVAEALDDIIRKAAPDYLAILALQKLIEPDLRSGKWQDALTVARSYRPKFIDHPDVLDSLIALLERPAQEVQLIRLDTSVNSPRSEYSPVLTADGRQLFFCRNDGFLMSSDENIRMSERQADGWRSSSPVEPFAGEGNESPLGISSDGNELLIFNNAVIMLSRRTAEGWSEPQPIGEAVNRADWQGGACFSADGKALLFAARCPQTLGPGEEDIDIFVSLKGADGRWGEPINLGPAVNSPLEDRSPFLHPDQKTLYFSSRGHGGLGELDVYKVERLDDSWTNWSTPVNMGREINTATSDWGYKVTTEGDRAYFAAGEGEQGSDIFFLTLPESLRPQRVSTVSGTVVDAADGRPLQANVVIEDLKTGETVARLQSNPATGDFFITLPQGRLYSYSIRKEGYLEQADHLDLSSAEQVVNLSDSDIKLYTIKEGIEKGVSLILNNIFFDSDKSDIQPESFPQLNRLAELLKEQEAEVEISGHTDNQGTAQYNRTLSRERAEAVKQYLESKGVSPEKLSARGYGESRPVAGNDSEEGRAQNRRVEIRFR